MPTLLMQLVGPLQSWGVSSRFDERDTELEPSKSGVLGLVCAALGVDRSVWDSSLDSRLPTLKTLSALKLGVRVDREGILRVDYHTAKGIVGADGKKLHATAVSRRYYLSDAVFLVGLEGESIELLKTIQAALKDPFWPLSLGRKSFVPSRPVWLPDEVAVQASDLESSLSYSPWLVASPQRSLRLVLEHKSGSLRMDQPLASFEKRRFGARFVEQRVLTVVKGETGVLESPSP